MFFLRRTGSPPAIADAHAPEEAQATLDALGRSQAVIEFSPDGTILAANDLFLALMGYGLEEIRGKHHSMFAEPAYAASDAYREFWDKLGHGEFQAAQYKRLGKGGKEVWIEASYNPVVDRDGKPFKVVKFATDVTRRKMEYANLLGQVNAIRRSQAVIEFALDGTILDANEVFLAIMGYSSNEVQGKPHAMFAEPGYAISADYREFWAKLNRGEFQAAQYKRLGKDGKEVWIEASYNPIFDLNGKPFKVVKYATDVTRQKMEYADLLGQAEAIRRSQAVIEFALDGTILDANDVFLSIMGYTLGEVKGQRHAMFAEPGCATSAEYRDFWAKLHRGEYQAAQYKRVGKGGKAVWIEASYNPIFDLNGKPFKVVKFATDLTPRKEANAKLASDFEQGVKALVDSVTVSASSMQETAQTLADASGEVNQQSSIVAAATDQLSASVTEVSRRADESARIAQGAVSEVTRSQPTVKDLLDTAQKIGEVTQIISNIAAQTNLLALNATIEAARAGEHGKGFAVVASEVKMLANQTTKATEEIGQQIGAIQASSESMASAMQAIGKTIGQLNDINASISSSVEDQAAATQKVAVNIHGVRESAKQNGHSSADVLRVAQGQLNVSERLQASVDRFLLDVRAM